MSQPIVADWREEVAAKLVERLGKREAARAARWMQRHPEKTLAVFERLKALGTTVGAGVVSVALDDVVTELWRVMSGGVGDG
jgi:hypothetical protein